MIYPAPLVPGPEVLGPSRDRVGPSGTDLEKSPLQWLAWSAPKTAPLQGLPGPLKTGLLNGGVPFKIRKMNGGFSPI